MKKQLERLTRHIEEKRYGKYRGIVIDNKDPEKRGRLKLRVPTVLDKQVTNWALPCMPYGGANQQGMFMIPEVDALVWVEFEEGDINCPIWVGTFWQHEGETPEDATREEPTTRLLQTRSGHILQFDDADGEERIRLQHSTEANMVIDPDGTISLTDASGATLLMDAENNEIVIEDANGNTMTMNSAGTKVEDANGNVIEMAAAGITAEASKIVLKGSQIHLGDESGEPLIKGQSFLNLFATHIHTVAPIVGGPTSPPIPQGEVDTLSTTVKTI